MSVENFILLMMKYNNTLIEVLVALILLATIYLAWRGLKAPPEAGAVGNLAELEETLKKLLEKAAVVPGAADAQAGGPPAELLAEIETLKKGLEERQLEIENLKTLGNSGGSAPANAGMSDEERAKLEVQIKELQGKLAEYEIISEDIADLSFYKEENAKLQKQLEAAKAGGGGGAPAAAAPKISIPATAALDIGTPAAAAPAAPAAPEAAPAPTPTSAPVSEETPAPAPAVAEVGGIDDDLMAEFAAAVESQKGATGAAPAAAAPAAPPAPEPAKASDSAAAPAEAADGIDLGQMDMDKMLAEAEGIGTAPAEGGEAPNALEAGLDADKLLQEASELPGVRPEDKSLMNEFENFVKKGP